MSRIRVDLLLARQCIGGDGWLVSLERLQSYLPVSHCHRNVPPRTLQSPIPWAPLASERFRELIEARFFDDSRFFRVIPNYVAQFGIASDPALNKEWMFCERSCRALVDEPRLQSNRAGTLSFASSGKNSRQTQIFINLVDNSGLPNFLDSQGFVSFARVTKGFDTVVKKLNSEYGLKESISGGLTGSVNQGKAAYYGKEYLDTVFPNLSAIKWVRII